VLVNGRAWTSELSYLVSPAILAVVAGAALLAAGPRVIRLQARE
jgi:ABC-2 type transport system permease protein